MNITLRLNESEIDAIAEKAQTAGITVNVLLENFIADLIDGEFSNGSDERRLANEYFNRCSFNWGGTSTTFIRFLVSYGLLKDFATVLNTYETAQTALKAETDQQEIIYIKDEIEDAEAELKDYYREYRQQEQHPQTYKEGVAGVKRYLIQLQKMKEGERR